MHPWQGLMHRQAEQAEDILATYQNRQVSWTVSMEVDFYVDEMGFAVAGRNGVEAWEEKTPEDLLKRLGWVYVPYAEAPAELRECWDDEQSRMRERFRAQETVGLFGGLDGKVHFKGIGLTPLGKEKEARVGQVLAGAGRLAWWGGFLASPEEVLRKTVGVMQCRVE